MENKKVILQIANYSAHYRGNFIESLDFLKTKLESKNIQTIFCFYCDEEPEKWMTELEKAGEKVFYLSGDWKKDRKLLRKILRFYSVNIIHTHFITSKQYLSISSSKWGFKCKVIMHIHNHSRKATFLKGTLRKILYHSCYMIACSDSVYESVCRDYPKNKKCVINNGLLFERIESLEAAELTEYNLKDNTCICLIFGFDFFRKGVDIAVRAIDLINSETTKVELVISLSKNFEIVEKNIIDILGCIPKWIHIIHARDDVGKLYNLADIFLSPSREEGLPYSVLEAGYSKCDVIMSDISAQKNLKIPYGYWCKNEDMESLVQVINDILIHGNRKQSDLESVRKSIREEYSLEKWEQQIENVYRENGLQI